MYQENLDVELILLDARSNAHVERLRQQRLICGWRAECVDEWREQQLQKNKYMFWIVSSLIVVYERTRLIISSGAQT